MGKLKKGLQLSVGSMICGVGKYQKFDEDQSDAHLVVDRAARTPASDGGGGGVERRRTLASGGDSSSSALMTTGVKAKNTISYSCEECGHKGVLKVRHHFNPRISGPNNYVIIKQDQIKLGLVLKQN